MGLKRLTKIILGSVLALTGLVFLIVAFFVLSWVFAKPPTVAQVVGTYTLSEKGLTDQLILFPDGAAQQTIIYSDGERVTEKSGWKLTNFAVELGEHLQPYDENARLRNGMIDFVVKRPPEKIGSCIYLWEGNAITRWDGRLRWQKTP